MPISIQDVQKMATLARLDISTETQELFAAQFANILSHMNTLAQVNTDDVEPLYSPVLHSSALRPDVIQNAAQHMSALRAQPDDILANAPDREGQYFRVPRIV